MRMCNLMQKVGGAAASWALLRIINVQNVQKMKDGNNNGVSWYEADARVCEGPRASRGSPQEAKVRCKDA